MAGKRPPNSVVDARRDLAVACLCLCWPKWKIKDAIVSQYGVSRKSAERDVGRAREKLSEEDATPRADKRSKVSAFLEDVLGDRSIDVRHRIRAAREYTRLHGLQENPEDEGPPPEVEVELPNWRQEMIKALENKEILSARHVNGGSETNGNGSK